MSKKTEQFDAIITNPEALRRHHAIAALIDTPHDAAIRKQTDAVHAALLPRLADNLRAASTPGTFDAQMFTANHIAPWFRVSMIDALLDWTEGKSRTCMHAPDGNPPQAIHACAWKPGLIVCDHCQAMLMLPAKHPDRYRCDSCGRLDPNIRTYATVIGPLAYQAGACADCNPFHADNTDTTRATQ